MEQQVNLFQPMFRVERHLFSARAIAASLGVAALALLGVWGYGCLRMTRLDRELGVLHQQELNRGALTAREVAFNKADASLPELEARIHALDLELSSRREALAVLHRGSPAPAEGYAARLQALGRAHVRGVWLQKITLSNGDGRLALQGASVDPAAIPSYVQALKAEHVLNGAQFDEINVERSPPGASPPQVSFRLADARLTDGRLARAESHR